MIRKRWLLSGLVIFLPNPVTAQGLSVTDPDSVLTLTLPADWRDAAIEAPDASVRMADAAEEAFLMVIVESKDDFFGWNMTRFVYVTIGQHVAALDLPEVSDIEYTEVDGSPAAKVTVAGASSGQQFRYLRLAVEAPRHWVQVILGSLRSAWDANESVFQEIVGSIDLLPN